MTKPAASPVETAAPLTPAKLALDATPSQKSRIRQKLDGLFDDEKGCYLEGYSDQKIGKELDLPSALVGQVRETAYGPIRVDPALANMAREIEAAQSRVDGVVSELARLKAAVAKLGGPS